MATASTKRRVRSGMQVGGKEMKAILSYVGSGKIRLGSVVIGLILCFGLPAFSQIMPVQPLGQAPATSPSLTPPASLPGQTASQPTTPAAIDLIRGGDLVLGPADVVDIQITDAPDLSGKYLISDTGEIRVPTVKDPIHATGLTTSQLSSAVAVALKDAKQLQEPIVSVFVEEYHSHTVTVLGAVAKPGQYPVETRTSLLQAISEAGGLATNAGGIASITHAPAPGAGPGKPEAVSAKSELINIGDINSGSSPAISTYVHAGDVITVSTAAVIYVVGAVTRPGAFALQPDKDVTLLQALSLVGGFAPSASPNRAVIVRKPATDKDREEIPVDLNKILGGKKPDDTLQANDILFIPYSGVKKGLHRMGDAAITAATDVVGLGAVYGIF
jgi:polysaccharide biosynthesis/export protein